MKKNIYLMYAIALFQGMVFYGPIATLYRRAQDVSIFQITLIESISLGLCLLLEIPWGVIADKIGYKRTMVFCCGLYVCSKIVFWQATGFWWFLVERVMLSVVIAGLSGVDTSILFLSSPKGESQRAFGIYNSLQMVGLLMATLVFSAVVGTRYKLAGGLTVISYGLAALAALGLTEVKPKETRTVRMRDIRELVGRQIRSRHMLPLLVAVALLTEVHQVVTVFLNQLQYERCDLPPSAMGYVYMGVTVVGLCGMLSPRVTGRLGKRMAGTLFFGTGAISCVLLAVTLKPGPSIAGVMLIRASNSLFQPLQMKLQNTQVRTDNRATELSVNAMLISSVGVGTNLAFGALAQWSLSGSLLFGGGLCLMGWVLLRSWHHRENHIT